MRKLRIVLCDLSYDIKSMQGSLYVPLGVGYLAAYVHKKYAGLIDIKIFKDPIKLFEYFKIARADVIGFSHYFWNSSLNEMVIKKIRREYRENIKIVLGGPSIDSDAEVLLHTCNMFPEVDYFVMNEGEMGFANIVGMLLSGKNTTTAIDGVAFKQDSKLFCGKNIGLSTELATLDSPYLHGFMDPFMQGEYLVTVGKL